MAPLIYIMLVINMTDSSNTTERRTISAPQLTISAIALNIAIQINPYLVKYLNEKAPFLGEAVSMQIVTFAETGVGAFYMWFTFRRFVKKIIDIIYAFRSAGKAILQALFCKDVPPLDVNDEGSDESPKT